MFVPIEAESIIAGLTDQLLDRRAMWAPGKSRYDADALHRIRDVIVQPGLLFDLRIRVEHPKRVVSSAQLMIALCGNTKVWIAKGTGEERWRHLNDIDAHVWENTSSHDSCWKTDGLRDIVQTYFDLCEELNLACGTDMAPADMSVSAHFSSFGRPIFRNVDITYRKCSVTYKYELLKIEESS